MTPIRSLQRVLRARWRRPPELRPFEPRPSGAARLSGESWRATGGDPQLVFPAPRDARSLTLYLAAPRDGGLVPRLYFDWGPGFHEPDSLGFAPIRAALIRVDFTDAAELRQVRLDPFEGHGDFVFRWGVDGQGEALARDVEPDLAALTAERAEVLRAEIAVADYAPASRGRPPGRRRTPQTPQEHFLRACALAADLAAPASAATPLISFVSPLYNTPPAYLDDLLASFRQQTPGLAELILSDDGSSSKATAKWLAAHEREPGVVILRNGVNRGIAAACNAGASAARGGWISFVDHDDALSPHAVKVIARALTDNPKARFVYTDEVVADAKLRPQDFFDKPAFDAVLLSGVNYINHFSIYARDLFAAVGGFLEGYDGSQDYDLLLRALARLSPDEVRHIPYPAYLWRRDGHSFSVKYVEKAVANARRALAEAYAKDGRAAEVGPANLPYLHRVRLAHAKPKVSIIVPNRDSYRLMRLLTDGLYNRTEYPDFELIVVDNGSTDPDTLALYESLKAHSNFTLYLKPAPFNFSAQVNRGFALAKGGAALLLNNDIEVTEPDWLAEMVECLAYPNAGIVGARLLYPRGDLQHAGVMVGLGGLAGHWFHHRPADYPGPMGRLAVRSTLSAVTGACMLVSRPCWEAVGGFDEVDFAVAYNDVDFCLRATAAGWRTIYTPFATLIHHESATRGPDDGGPNRARFLRDQAALLERHGTGDFCDPASSPWRDRVHAEPGRVALERLPGVR